MSKDTVESLLKLSTNKIPFKDKLWLLSELLNQRSSEILLNKQQNIPKALTKKFKSWIQRRKKGEPLQYIVGRAEFFGRSFQVNSHVLIPRPETEILVELALKFGDALEKSSSTKIRVIDIGTGSGCIPISIKLERPEWTIGASDISQQALVAAKHNAHDLRAQIDFRYGNLLHPWLVRNEKIHLVVANLPYLDRVRDSVSREVDAWEPALALYPKQNRKSQLKHSGGHLAEELILECLQQAGSVQVILLELSARVAYNLEGKFRKHAKIRNIRREADLAGRKRFLYIELA